MIGELLAFSIWRVSPLLRLFFVFLGVVLWILAIPLFPIFALIWAMDRFWDGAGDQDAAQKLLKEARRRNDWASVELAERVLTSPQGAD